MTHFLVKPKSKPYMYLQELLEGDFDEEVYEILYEDESEGIYIHFYPNNDIYILHLSTKNALLLIPQDVLPEAPEYVNYVHFLQKALYHDEVFAKEAHELVRSMDASIAQLEFQWKPVDVHTSQVPNKAGGYDNVLVSSGTVEPAGLPVHIDLLELYQLCDAKLDLGYLVKSVNHQLGKKTLIVCAFDKDQKLRGIRVTYLSRKGGPLAKIKGSFACSKGMGTLLQQETENLIREKFAYLFDYIREQTGDTSALRTRKRPQSVVDFELYAVPTAVGFWKHVGFKETGKKKGNTSHMSKRIRVEDRSSGN